MKEQGGRIYEKCEVVFIDFGLTEVYLAPCVAFMMERPHRQLTGFGISDFESILQSLQGCHLTLYMHNRRTELQIWSNLELHQTQYYNQLSFSTFVPFPCDETVAILAQKLKPLLIQESDVSEKLEEHVMVKGSCLICIVQ